MEGSAARFWKLFHRAPVVGIMRGMPMDMVMRVADTYQRAGLTTLEVTMNTEGATETIAALVRDFPMLSIGAGTVCTTHDCKRALGAGAQFIVTPTLSKKVVEYCVKRFIPILPGALTPTEIYKAWDWGATAVKVFPAGPLGPSYLKAVLGPLDEYLLLPTGGVSLDNIGDYLAAGAVGVGMGGSLFPERWLREDGEKRLRRHFEAVLDKIKAPRQT